MQIVVLGAAGRTGREVISQATTAGHEVIALARTTHRSSDATQWVTGDATVSADLRAAFDGADSVISVLGGKDATVIQRSTHAVIDAAHATGVKRVTVLSSFAVRRDQLAGPVKLLSSLAMGKMIKDKVAGEAELRASDLDWTIVHATVLTDGPRTNSAHPVPDGAKVGAKDKISRAEVAAFLIDATVHDDYRRRDVLITG